MLIACLILSGMHVPCTPQLKREQAHIAHVLHLEHMEHVRYLAWKKEHKPTVKSYVPHGNYSCSGLESLWVQAGGNPSDKTVAASVAMAESGGNPNAISPTNDYGLWQINGSWGSLATLNPYYNAKSAVIISRNGANWTPWTTYVDGLYYRRC